MDPLSAIASIISIIDAIEASYAVIQRIKNLPQAFAEVGNSLPLLKATFEKAKARLNPEAVDENTKTKVAVGKKLKQCEADLESLKDVFNKIQKEFESESGDGTKDKIKEWADKLAQLYKSVALVATGKDKRVEELMKKVVKGLRDLTAFEIFREPFKYVELGALQDLLVALSKVQPSVEEETGPGMSLHSEGDNANIIQSQNFAGKTINTSKVTRGGMANVDIQGDMNNTNHFGSSSDEE